MPSAVADGMDVLNMRKVVKEAVDRARTEKTPTLIEARCYRFMGHSMSDPVHGVYRTKEEVEEHKEKDPIRRFIDQLRTRPADGGGAAGDRQARARGGR
jgi:pyruvate dehydrogenase E1 component alpha subunit